jgi:hypothetical protein
MRPFCKQISFYFDPDRDWWDFCDIKCTDDNSSDWFQDKIVYTNFTHGDDLSEIH